MDWDGSLIWYQSLDDQVVTNSNLTIPVYLIKNQAQGNMSLSKFQVQRAFTLEDVLKNNINHILKP